MNTAIAQADTTSRALVVATAGMNDAIHNHVVALAFEHGSTTLPSVRYIHFSNATAKAIGLPKSDAAVIAALPIEDRALLALVRHGVAQRIPAWAAQCELEGGAKPHNRIRIMAGEWAAAEVAALKAVGIEEVITRASALTALEVHHG